jgi:hypothetical protein
MASSAEGGFWAKMLFQSSMVVMVAVEVVSLGAMALGQEWVGEWLWVSPSAFAAVFLATGLLMRRRGLAYMEAFLVALTAMVSMIWMYEIWYHFGFYADWEFGKQSQGLVIANYNQPVVIDVLLASVGLVGLKYMRAGAYFWASFAAFVVAFLFWVAIGYPQVTSPGSLFPFGSLLIKVPDPAAWAWPLNALTKYLLAACYVALFLGKSEAWRY